MEVKEPSSRVGSFFGIKNDGHSFSLKIEFFHCFSVLLLISALQIRSNTVESLLLFIKLEVSISLLNGEELQNCVNFFLKLIEHLWIVSSCCLHLLNESLCLAFPLICLFLFKVRC